MSGMTYRIRSVILVIRDNGGCVVCLAKYVKDVSNQHDFGWRRFVFLVAHSNDAVCCECQRHLLALVGDWAIHL